MKKAVFNLEPLGCPTCVRKIEGTLEKTDGVEEVRVMFHSNRVRTQFDESIIQAEDIESKIVKLGYPVISHKVS